MNWKNTLRWLEKAPAELQPLLIELLESQFGFTPFDPKNNELHRLWAMLWSAMTQLLATKYITIRADRSAKFQHRFQSIDPAQWHNIRSVGEVRAREEMHVIKEYTEALAYELDALVMSHLIDLTFKNNRDVQTLKCEEPTNKKMDTIGSLIEDRTGKGAEWSHTNWLFPDSNLKQYPWSIKDRSIIANREAITLCLGRFTVDQRGVSLGLQFVVNKKAMLIVDHNAGDSDGELNLNQLLEDHYRVDCGIDDEILKKGTDGNGTTQAGGLPADQIANRG